MDELVPGGGTLCRTLVVFAVVHGQAAARHRHAGGRVAVRLPLRRRALARRRPARRGALAVAGPAGAALRLGRERRLRSLAPARTSPFALLRPRLRRRGRLRESLMEEDTEIDERHPEVTYSEDRAPARLILGILGAAVVFSILLCL